MTVDDDMTTGPSRDRHRKRNRWLLLGMAALFAAPMVAALLWRPTTYVNHGDLVRPARPVTDIGLRAVTGQPVRVSDLWTKWTFVYFAVEPCDEACRRSLHDLAQVRLAQGRHANRVQLVAVMPDDVAAADRSAATAQQPGLMWLTAERETLARLAADFDLGDGGPMAGAQRVYLVDPLGNLMMSYARDIDPTAVRRDLARLLKVSQVG